MPVLESTLIHSIVQLRDDYGALTISIGTNERDAPRANDAVNLTSCLKR